MTVLRVHPSRVEDHRILRLQNKANQAHHSTNILVPDRIGTSKAEH